DCLPLAPPTDDHIAKPKGISAFAISMHQPGIEQRPLKMINGVTKEFGEVIFDGARVPAANMIGDPGEGWSLAMTVVNHERQPGELGYVARYPKLVKELVPTVSDNPSSYEPEHLRALRWAVVDTHMPRPPVSWRTPCR